MKTKKLLIKIFFPVLLAVVFLFNLTACSQDRFMSKSEYLSGLPSSGLISGSITFGVNSYGTFYQEFTLEFDLDYNAAPITVTNFVYLVQTGFYDYTKFNENNGKEKAEAAKPVMHRLIKNSGFFLQGGGYKSNIDDATDIVELATGGLGYGIKGEFKTNGWEDNKISHKAGVLSMARQSGYDTAASEFFITFGPSTAFDEKYAAFGTLRKIDSTLMSVLDHMPTISEKFSFSSSYLNDYPKYKIEIVGITVNTNIKFPEPLKITK